MLKSLLLRAQLIVRASQISASFFLPFDVATRSTRLRLSLLSCLLALVAILGGLGPWLLSQWFSHWTEQGIDLSMLAVFAAFLLPPLAQGLVFRKVALLTAPLSTDLKLRLLASWSLKGLPAELPRGEALTLLDHDTAQVELALRTLVCSTLPSFVGLLTVLCAVAALNPSFLVLFAGYAVLLWLVFQGARDNLQTRQGSLTQALARRRTLMETLAHHSCLLIQPACRPSVLRAISEHQCDVAHAQTAAFMASQPPILAPQMAHCGVLLVIFLWLAPDVAAMPAATGALLALVLYSERVVWPIIALAADWVTWQSAVVARQRIQARLQGTHVVAQPVGMPAPVAASLVLMTGPTGSGKTQFLKRHATRTQHHTESCAPIVPRAWQPMTDAVFVDMSAVSLWAALFETDRHQAMVSIVNTLCEQRTPNQLCSVYLDEAFDDLKVPALAVDCIEKLIAAGFEVYVTTHCEQTRRKIQPLSSHWLQLS